jgi:molybdate transport system ATP-binding protein
MIAIDLALPIGARRRHVVIRSGARAIAIVGPSGAGKSTLLRAVLGLIAHAEGAVSIAGVTMQDDARRLRLAPRERRLGWVPQDALLFPHLDVRDNVGFGARDRSDIELARELGIEHLLDRAPATLSGGERQRVAIARALASGPRAILLDEPLAALDRDARREIAAVIRARCEARGITRIIVAHDEADLAALADERFPLEG